MRTQQLQLLLPLAWFSAASGNTTASKVLSVDSFGRWIKQHAAYVGQACCGGLISLLLSPRCVWCS